MNVRRLEVFKKWYEELTKDLGTNKAEWEVALSVLAEDMRILGLPEDEIGQYVAEMRRRHPIKLGGS